MLAVYCQGHPHSMRDYRPQTEGRGPLPVCRPAWAAQKATAIQPMNDARAQIEDHQEGP
jgi:hypothetical protein